MLNKLSYPINYLHVKLLLKTDLNRDKLFLFCREKDETFPDNWNCSFGVFDLGCDLDDLYEPGNGKAGEEKKIRM